MGLGERLIGRETLGRRSWEALASSPRLLFLFKSPLQDGQCALVLGAPDCLLVTDQGRKAKHTNFKFPSDLCLESLSHQFVVSAARSDRPQQVEWSPTSHEELMTRRGEVRTVRPPIGRSGGSIVRLESFQCLQEPVDIVGFPGVNQIQIEGGDRGALQNRGHATHDDELDAVAGEGAENG